MATTTHLPDDLYNRVVTLGYFSASHRSIPEQRAARENLHRVLTQGEIDDLPGALRRHGTAWNKNIAGRYIEGENWVMDTAFQLAREVEFVISSSRQKQAA
jgi:hypothetical protein